MLEITLPYVEQWNVWYSRIENSTGGLERELRQVDEVCRKVGRDPAEVERTAAVLVRLAGGAGRVMGDTSQAGIVAVTGTPEEIADRLREFADLGLAEVQLVVDPITIESVRALAPMLAELDRG
jgi:alkanesulfonate monooxygenase SsuD/methylene tetrahydromethanopterin reductase-like flavin-dependent oxidoreductase (luciferase family)